MTKYRIYRKPKDMVGKNSGWEFVKTVEARDRSDAASKTNHIPNAMRFRFFVIPHEYYHEFDGGL